VDFDSLAGRMIMQYHITPSSTTVSGETAVPHCYSKLMALVLSLLVLFPRDPSRHACLLARCTNVRREGIYFA
jgi:hypothetical protein